jgi:hypothetical protein
MAGNTGGDGMMRALVAEVRRKDEIQRGLAAECSQMEQASAHLERDIQARRDQLQVTLTQSVRSSSCDYFCRLICSLATNSVSTTTTLGHTKCNC